jgi:hypothetical protein
MAPFANFYSAKTFSFQSRSFLSSIQYSNFKEVGHFGEKTSGKL